MDIRVCILLDTISAMKIPKGFFKCALQSNKDLSGNDFSEIISQNSLELGCLSFKICVRTCS